MSGAEDCVANLGINATASPGRELRNLGYAEKSSAIKSGHPESQGLPALQFRLEDLNTAMVAGVPWDFVFGKRKAEEPRDISFNTDKVRVYVEVSSSVQAGLGVVLNSLFQGATTHRTPTRAGRKTGRVERLKLKEENRRGEHLERQQSVDATRPPCSFKILFSSSSLAHVPRALPK